MVFPNRENHACVAAVRRRVVTTARRRSKLPWQVTNGIDDTHDFDSIFVRLIEDEPPFVPQIEPAFGCVRMSLTEELLGGVFRDAVSDLVVDPFPRRGLVVDERNVEQDVVEIRFGDRRPNHASH